MFPRRERLPRAAFPTTLQRGRRLSSPNLSIVISQETKGYAVVVSKKVARLSVTRHRIKRRILAALQDISLPTALIVFPRATAGSVSYQDIKKEIINLLSKKHS